MKVRDFLKTSKSPKLEGLKVRTSKSVVGYIFSIANGVVFLNNVEGNSTDKGRLYPQIISKEDAVKEWEIVQNDVQCNCDSLTSHKYIINE